MSPAKRISRFNAFVFDLDGTLVDSASDITAAMSLTLVDLGYPPLPSDYVMPNLHSTSDVIITDVFRDLGIAINTDIEVIRAMFYRNYTAHGHSASPLFPGVREFLQWCADNGIRMAICTNKKESIAQQALTQLGIADYFETVTGCDTYDEAKPSALPLLKTLESIKACPEDAIFFGDTQVDADCAQRSGVSFVLHLSGYGAQAAASFPRLLDFQHYEELFKACSD